MEQTEITTPAEQPTPTMSFGTLSSIRKLMDDWHIDPILGLFAPGIGDWVTTILTVPYIITSVFKLKSLSLTLAIIYNVLMDCLWGTIPVAGDFFDFLHRGFKKNCKLVEGFAAKDPTVVNEVKRKSVFFGIMIVILIALIFISIYFVKMFWDYLFDLFQN